MPTYKNTTKRTIVVGNTVVHPSETRQFFSYFKIEGVDMIDEKPVYNSTILSVKVEESKEVLIPEGENRFAIHFYAEKGEPTIYYNSDTNKPPLALYEGARWNVRTYERLINKVIVKLPKEGVLWILVERI